MRACSPDKKSEFFQMSWELLTVDISCNCGWRRDTLAKFEKLPSPAPPPPPPQSLVPSAFPLLLHLHQPLAVWLFRRSDAILAISFIPDFPLLKREQGRTLSIWTARRTKPKSGKSGTKEIAKTASDREKNHTASKNTPCK